MQTLKTVIVVLFVIDWLYVMGSFLYFAWRIAPLALRRWADELDLQIVDQRHAGGWDYLGESWRSGQQIYRITARDKHSVYKGLVIIRKPDWFVTSVTRCQVYARWKRIEPVQKIVKTPDPHKPGLDLWDRELDC